MLQQILRGCAMSALAVLFTIAIATQSAKAEKDGDTTVGAPQVKVAVADEQTREILLLISANEKGKVSEQEFMRYMKAEFDRFDHARSGQVDVKQLARPQAIPASRYGK